MIQPDFKALYLSIQRCNAVYIPDEAEAFAAFKALGSKVVARYSTDENQAILHYDVDGVLTLTISGTRVTEGTLSEHIHDLFEDIDCDPYDIGSGRKVAHQPFREAAVVYKWAASYNSKDPIKVEGHSLGGWKTTYASEYIEATRIISLIAWESPLQGNDAYWADLQKRGILDKFLNVFHGDDPWSLWPWETSVLNKGPKPVLWIKSGTSWVWSDKKNLPKALLINGYHLLSSNDHGPSSVITDVQKLAESEVS